MTTPTTSNKYYSVIVRDLFPISLTDKDSYTSAITDVIEQAKAALPPCDAQAQESVNIITMIYDPNNRSPMERVTYIITFSKLQTGNAYNWELKELARRIANSGNL